MSSSPPTPSSPYSTPPTKQVFSGCPDSLGAPTRREPAQSGFLLPPPALPLASKGGARATDGGVFSHLIFFHLISFRLIISQSTQIQNEIQSRTGHPQRAHAPPDQFNIIPDSLDPPVQ